MQFSISKLCNVGAVERWDDLLISQSKVCLEKLSLMYKSPLGLYFNMQAIFKVQNVQCCCSAERGMSGRLMRKLSRQRSRSHETHWKQTRGVIENLTPIDMGMRCTWLEIVAGWWAMASKQCAAKQKNIAKGTTDPRVEIILQVLTQILTQILSRTGINFKISTKYEHLKKS